MTVGGPFERVPVPKHFNWNLWQGQTPDMPYLAERSHYTFRWWRGLFRWSNDRLGAHHIDIAQWAVNSFLLRSLAKQSFPTLLMGIRYRSISIPRFDTKTSCFDDQRHGRNGSCSRERKAGYLLIAEVSRESRSMIWRRIRFPREKFNGLWIRQSDATERSGSWMRLSITCAISLIASNLRSPISDI